MEKKAKSRVLMLAHKADLKISVPALAHEYTIMIAKDGLACLRLAHASHNPALKPDIILIGNPASGMDGYEVCRQLKADPSTRRIPVIFIIDDESKYATYGSHIDAVDHIMKPVNIALLKTKIVNQIELRRHRDNLDELVKIRTRQLHMTQEATITAMATLAEWRDPETGAHIKRTQNYVRIIAAQMQKKPDYRKILTNDIIDLLYMSAPLHDVGKVSIPDSILLKPGPLDKNEFEKMKLHTVHGRDALAVTECKLGDESFLKIAREIAFGHHERWDGTGYPQGIAGQEIPLSARMMAVADVYDALSSKRVYKDKFDHTVVINIMLEGKGTQFDPEILDSFFGIHEKFLEIASEYADPI